MKASDELNNKSKSANLLVAKFEEAFLEPGLRLKYKEEIKKIDKGKFEKFSSVKELRQELEDS